jgi:presequence protease
MKPITTTTRVLKSGWKLTLIPILISCLIIIQGFAGKTEIHGFRLIEKRFVKEVNADCYYFEHIRSGARLIKIANDDPNKTFSIAFHTIPESDCGTPHILEHTVFAGSKNFPVKSSLSEIMKGSLKTFANALTGKDMTRYPIASMNEKDYFNLMHIYLDNVFNPKLTSDERIFKQEGWHYEIFEKDKPIVYRGIVHGEMSGYYSSAGRYNQYYTFKGLFPDNGYGFESGGHPQYITDLSYEEFLNFYQKYYHPENSYIFLYGDAGMEKELEFIDREYLSRYKKGGFRYSMAEQKPFVKQRIKREVYPVLEGSPTENQTYLSLNFVYGKGTEPGLSMALSLLGSYLFSGESAPVRQALQQAGIGRNISGGNIGYKQNVFLINVQNANPEDLERFNDIVFSSLQNCLDKGLDKDRLKGLINRYEFNLKENSNPQRGLNYSSSVYPGFMYDGNPFSGLEYEKDLKVVKDGLENNYFENLIRKAFLDNPHSLLLSVEPKPGLDKTIREETEKKLAAYKAKLSETEIESLIEDNKKLVDFQTEKDSQEALATIPKLSLDDISKKGTFYTATERKSGNNSIIHYKDFTNDVIYMHAFFDLRVLPERLLPYSRLLSYLLGSLNTGRYSFSDIDKERNNYTGGINSFTATFLEQNDETRLRPKFVMIGRAANQNINKLSELMAEITTNTDFTDTDRIKMLLTRMHSQTESSIKADGSGPTSQRLRSYFKESSRLAEIQSGYDFYFFLKDIMIKMESNPEEVVGNIKETADLLFSRNNVIYGLICSEEDFKKSEPAIESISKKLNDTKPVYQKWENLNPVPLNEAFLTASKVQYIHFGCDYKKLGYEASGKLRVLNKILSRDWFFQKIRIVGGAYGGGSSISDDGMITFTSFRDPNLEETIATYKETGNYLRSLNLTEEQMTQYIISTIADMDQPLTPSLGGQQALSNYFNKRTSEDHQKIREEILSTTLADIKGYSDMIDKVIQNGVICAYGNADRMKGASVLFRNMIEIK